MDPCARHPREGENLTGPCPVCGHLYALHVGTDLCPVCTLADLPDTLIRMMSQLDDHEKRMASLEKGEGIRLL